MNFPKRRKRRAGILPASFVVAGWKPALELLVAKPAGAGDEADHTGKTAPLSSAPPFIARPSNETQSHEEKS